MARHLTSIACVLLLALGAQAQNIVGYEYWFDQGDAARTYVPATPGTTIALTNAPLNTSGLVVGLHQACLRWKDQPATGQARWSSVVCHQFQVGQPGPWEITAVRYWVGTPANDSDPLIRYKYFSTPQDTIDYNGLLDLCGYPTGQQTLMLQLRDNHAQWSSVVARPVTVNPAGSLGMPSISASATTFCPGQVVTFTATPQTGSGFATPTGYTWQVPAGNGWSALPSNGNTIVVTIGSTSGSVGASATNACGVGPLGSRQVTLPDWPDQVAFINGPLQACIGSTVTYSVPLLPPGITFTWEISGGWTVPPTAGPSLTTVVGAADATISVIAQNACGNQALPRIATVAVAAPPDAGANGALAICSDGAPTDLFNALQGTPEAGGVWRFNGAVVPGTYDPALHDPGVYTYTVSGTGPCADATVSVTVTEPQAPNAGMDTAITLCSNAPPVMMTAQLDGAPDAGGVWTGPSNTGGVFNPATMLGGVYTYTVNGTSPCNSANAVLTITVQQAPSAGMGGPLELCEGSDPIALTSALNGSPALNGTWNGPGGAAFAGIFTPGQDAEGAYTYTVQGSGACAEASATLAVNVMQLQLTGINGPALAPVVETLLYTAMPNLSDADSIVWTLPLGWSWDPSDTDHRDATAYLLPPALADTFTLCAQAVGGGCHGDTICYETVVTVGVEEIVEGGSGIWIYPNPNDGRFAVRVPAGHGGCDFRVLDALGQEVLVTQHWGGDRAFDLSGLPAGMYLLHWVTNGRSGVSPLVLAR